MTSSKEREAHASDFIGVSATPAASRMHPRMAARINFVTLVKQRDTLFTQLDQLVDSLDYLSQFTDRFSNHASTTRDFLDQLAFGNIVSIDGLVLLDQIQQHVVGLVAQAAAYKATIRLPKR